MTDGHWHDVDADEYMLELAADRDEHDRDRAELLGELDIDRAELADWITEQGAQRGAGERVVAEHPEGGWRA